MKLILLTSILGAISIIITLPSVLVEKYSTPAFPSQITNISPSQTKPMFRDETLTLGIQHVHSQLSQKLGDIRDSLGAGVCNGDINQNGLNDIIFISGTDNTRYYGKKSWWSDRPSIAIYRNNKSHFNLIAHQIDKHISAPIIGCALADFNNDNLPDLILMLTNGSLLFKNNGGFNFTLVDSFNFSNLSQWTTCASIADINSDGLLDIFFCNYIHYKKDAKTLENNTGYKNTNKTEFNAGMYPGQQNQLLLNNGNMTFTDVSKETGIAKDFDRSLSAKWLHANNDNLLDLFVVNDNDSTSKLYIQNQNNLSFTTIAHSNSAYSIKNSRHIAGENNTLNNTTLTRAVGFSPTHLVKNPNLSYIDKSWENGISRQELIALNSWGLATADLNNNGHKDIVISNGNIEPDAYSPYMPTPQINSLILESEDKYIHHTLQVSPPRSPSSSRSVLIDDINLDGYSDIVITNNNDLPQILMSQQTKKSYNWVQFSMPLSGKWANAILSVNQDNVIQTSSNTILPTFLGSQTPQHHFVLEDSTPITVNIIQQDSSSNKISITSLNKRYILASDTWQAVLKNKDNSIDINSIVDCGELCFKLIIANKSSIILKELHLNPGFLETALSLPPQKHLLNLYINALTLSNFEVFQNAISAIETLEDERVTNFLLPYLENQKTKKICAVAKLFETWFSEEEAALKTKKLAIPYLIRLLKHHDKDVISCAANALAEAEHETSEIPLIQAIDERHIESTLNIIRTLGQIRQRSTLKKLNNLLQLNNPKISIEVFIALNRIINKKRSTNRAIEKYFNSKSNSLNDKLIAYNYYHDHKYSSILDDKLINQLITKIITENNQAKIPKTLQESNAALLGFLKFSHKNKYNIDQIIVNLALKSNDKTIIKWIIKNNVKLTTDQLSAILPVLVDINISSIVREGDYNLNELIDSTKQYKSLANLRPFFTYLNSRQQQSFLDMSPKNSFMDNEIHNITLLDNCYPKAKTSVSINENDLSPILEVIKLANTNKNTQPLTETSKRINYDSLNKHRELVLECLSKLSLPIKTREKISSIFLTNHNLSKEFKYNWVFSAPHPDRFSQSILDKQFTKPDFLFIKTAISKNQFHRFSISGIRRFISTSNPTENEKVILKLLLKYLTSNLEKT